MMRDIMGGQGSNGDPGMAEARNTTLVERHGPIERVINITFEEGPAHTDETQVRDGCSVSLQLPIISKSINYCLVSYNS